MRLVLSLILALITVTGVAQDSGRIFAVRHAEKQSADKDTALSRIGMNRAQCLAKTLRDAHITAVFTTQYIRTQQTAEPTAREASVKPTVLDASSNAQVVEEAKAAARSGNVLIVGHGNTVPDIVAALGAPKPAVPDDVYDLLFVIDTAAPQHLTTLHYCPNLPKEASRQKSMMKP